MNASVEPAPKRNREEISDRDLKRRMALEFKGLVKAERMLDLLLDARRHGAGLSFYGPEDKQHRKDLNAVVSCRLCGWAVSAPSEHAERGGMSLEAPKGKELDALGYWVGVYSSEGTHEDIRWGVFHATCAKAVKAWAKFKYPLDKLINATKKLLAHRACHATIPKPEQPVMSVDEYVAKRQKFKEEEK